MPNIVGIGNSQVPTNAMLGGLAYQDSVGEIDLEKIKARTSDTATDIFVYDTRKDSDGGAWRHRTQNLSWYNEGVNQYRGARKEFPAVAVIVAETSPAYKVTIYDGDDPNMSLWMQWIYVTNDPFLDYSTPGSHHLGNYAPESLSAMNGIVCVGTFRSAGHISNLNAGIREFHFVKDECFATNNDKRVKFPTSIVDRNVVTTDYKEVTSPRAPIVNSNVNDVAMTVLPNAPIDASTGLPIPTIAIATDGGTNIINDNGTVTQGYQTIATENVDLHPDGFMTDGISGATNDSFSFYKIGTIARLASYGHRANVHNITTFLNEGTGECLFEGSGNKIAIAQSLGLLRIEETYPESFTPGNDALSFGLHNRTTSSYNTGWMHGAIKGAFISDTDTTDLNADTLNSAGNFDSTFSTSTGWSNTADWTISGGVATCDGQNNNRFLYPSSMAWPIGTSLVVEITVTAYTSGTLNVSFDTGNATAGTDMTATGTYKFVGTVSGNTIAYIRSASFIGSIDNVKMYIAEFDRSVNNNGLIPYGTVPKQVVATGAELVSYGPFSTSNRLRQPYNSDLNFETNDFSVMFWMNNSGTDIHQTLVGRDNREFSVDILDNSSYDRKFRIYAFNSSNGLQTFDSNADPFPLNTWSHVCVNFTGGNTVSIYVNGVLNKAGSLNYDIDDTSNGLNIGCRNTSGSYAHAADGTKLALVRIAGSAPSAEQVKKIYNDEKCLYHENAKCTLNGTSDAVTGLAFDDTNDVLHVGTSSGRSEFRGLNRINNTTTAVTTAISASNELVAEQ